MSLLSLFVISILVIQGSTLATTIYLHRTLTHRSMEIHPVIAFLFHLHLMIFTGITPREWVAVHRKHHQFSDKEGDPHSPRIYGLWRVFFGNVYYYRRTASDADVVRKYTPDYKGTVLDAIHFQGYCVLIGLAIFMALFGWIGAVAFLLQSVTYILLNASINSICHMIGYRNFDNLATNLRVLALFTGGEALHNNHHEYPTSARFSFRSSEFDIAWPLIRMMEVLGLASVKRLPAAKAA